MGGTVGVGIGKLLLNAGKEMDGLEPEPVVVAAAELPPVEDAAVDVAAADEVEERLGNEGDAAAGCGAGEARVRGRRTTRRASKHGVIDARILNLRGMKWRETSSLASC